MSIEVHVRVRPSVANIVWSSAETVLYSTANPNTRYVYNKVYPSNSTNESIFHGMEAVVHAAFDGKNVTIMAYGQTGSGKTHSMIGVDYDPGMVPRAAKLLLELKRTTPGATIQAFYTEIYNESVKDLLEPQRGELALHDAPDGGVSFEKKMIDVETFDDFLQLQAAAERNRKYGVTNLNEHSSRSHVILTFEIHRRNRVGKSVINLVDLAGSESASRANTEGISLREGGYINRSLLTLGNVVDAIVERRPYVPYRDAKLTRLLRTCLGGSGITLILCCVNPSRENFDQTVATLRFTQRAMKIKNDPVVVLNMPPLFTHQYSDGARQLIEGLQESAEAEYQRGLRDSFLYCCTTIASVVSNYQAQVSDCLHSLANAQRLLVAHDHAMAIDHIGRLYNQQNDLVRQRISNQELAENERKRQRDVASEIESRKEKIEKLEEELRTKASSLDTNLAGWEYQLYEARQKQRSEMDVLLHLELARRARIQYEWVVCLERIASRNVPIIQAGLSALQAKLVESTSGGSGSAEYQQYHHLLHTILPLQDGDAENRTLHMKELRAALMKARDELADLKTAHEMVKDDIEEAKRQHQQDSKRESASVSPQPRPNLSDLSEDELVEYYRGVADSEVEERIHRLEREEKALMAQARRGVRRESLRRVRESLHVSRGSRGASSRSPQSGTGGVTITRVADTTVAAPASNVSQHCGRSVADEEGRTAFRPTETTAPAEARGRRSSASYAEGVKNALSILDSLKAQLQRRGGNHHASPTAASTSRHQQTQSQRQKESSRLRNPRSVSSSSEMRRRQCRKGVDETAVYHNSEDDYVGEEHECGTSRSAAGAAVHRRHHATAYSSADDTENMSLAELYQASKDKENWRRLRPPAAVAAVSRAAQKYSAVAEDDVAFDVDEEAEERKEDGQPVPHQLTSSPPIGIAARRKMKRQNSRPAVERALYALNSNSHSKSPS